MNPTTEARTTRTVTTTTTTTVVSQPTATRDVPDSGPTMKLKDRGDVPHDTYEIPNPLVRMGEKAVASLRGLFFTTMDAKWIALYHILTDVSEIPYSPSGSEFLSGLEAVVAENKHRFPALRELRDKMVDLTDGKETTAQVQVFLDLFKLLLEMESPSTEDPHVALLCNFESAKKICKQLDSMLISTESASVPTLRSADDD